MATTRTTPSNLTVKITANDKGNPTGKLADAELHFGDGVPPNWPSGSNVIS